MSDAGGTPGLAPALLERFRADPYARRMGFELLDAGPGYARVAAALGPDGFNFAGFPHGGLLFSLADYAFSVASNSHGQVAVATSVSIQYLAAAEPGDRLVAEARETRATRRAGFYTMTVATAAGRLLAQCLGVVQRLDRAL